MNLETHTNILHAVMKKVAQREVPSKIIHLLVGCREGSRPNLTPGHFSSAFFELEQNILTAGGRVTDRAAAISLLKDGTKGNLADKV
jgi:hypothetical protein